MSYCETSAKINSGVNELFNSIIANIKVNKDKSAKLQSPSNNNATTSACELNRTRLVKISKEKKQFPCCYI